MISDWTLWRLIKLAPHDDGDDDDDGNGDDDNDNVDDDKTYTFWLFLNEIQRLPSNKN